MPRVSEAEKRKSHKRIVDAASRLMRENGVEATSVSDVMQSAGLTHGGFYRHFTSKDELVAEAFRQAAGEFLEVLGGASEKARADARDGYIDRYLSPQHVDDRAKGCPFAAMAAEITRLDGAAKRAASAGVGQLAEALQGEGDATRDRGLAIMALLLGTITLARLVDADKEAGTILEAGRVGTDLLRESWPL